MSALLEDEKGGGWLFFAGTMLGLAGVMRIFDAIWAFRYDGALPENLQGALFGTTLSTYGWVYLAVAAVLILSSFAVLSRSQLARWIGIIGAMIMAISAIWWMPFFPVWSITYVILATLVIYALAAYGGRNARV